MNRLCDADGHFSAGFLEGEAHFGITEANGGQSYGCFMSLRLRDDDAALVDWLRDATGIGFTRPVPARRTSKPQVEWRVQTQADCRALAELLGRFPVRGRRRREVRIWRNAVDWWNSGVSNRALPMRGLRERLADSRLYRPPSTEVLTRPESRDALRAYLHGLLHGSLPTAMQFFRWRLVEAPATPTQATVYRLFPGGWPAVLAAYEASADRA